MLIIDNREGKLIELIKNTQSFTIPYELKNLQIGDIIISNSKYPDKSIIIERKCVPDMLASIKDGRYKEQKIRLQAEKCNSNGNKIICYLIEGSLQDVRYPLEKKMFHGSLISSMFRDEIPLIRSISLIETLEIIIRIHDRIEKDMNDFFKPISITNTIANSNEISILNETITTEPPITNGNTIIKEEEPIVQPNTQNGGDSSYLNSIKKCKKDNLTPKLWNQISYTNIPGVSTNIATKISEVYPSLKKLFREYDKCETDETRIKLISEIILTDNGKTKRRIGEVVSKRILEYLYSETN